VLDLLLRRPAAERIDRADSPGMVADSPESALFVQGGCGGSGGMSGPPWLEDLADLYPGRLPPKRR